LKSEDEKGDPRQEGVNAPKGANRPDAAAPRGVPQPEGVEVEWTAEEHRLLAQLESDKEGDLTEAIRGLVAGMLRQVRADLGKSPLGELPESEEPDGPGEQEGS
jgi:hypothetical protein